MPAPDANFWAVFECAPDAYLLLATDAPRFTMVAANEARLRMTMTRRKDVIGRPLFEVARAEAAPKSKVTVDAELRGGRIAVTVADTGPGIPDDKHEAIFEEYTRLDPEAQQGAGIGLAISRRIARLLGGDLTVESEAGRGATFTLWLPPVASS